MSNWLLHFNKIPLSFFFVVVVFVLFFNYYLIKCAHSIELIYTHTLSLFYSFFFSFSTTSSFSSYCAVRLFNCLLLVCAFLCYSFAFIKIIHTFTNRMNKKKPKNLSQFNSDAVKNFTNEKGTKNTATINNCI